MQQDSNDISKSGALPCLATPACGMSIPCSGRGSSDKPSWSSFSSFNSSQKLVSTALCGRVGDCKQTSTVRVGCPRVHAACIAGRDSAPEAPQTAVLTDPLPYRLNEPSDNVKHSADRHFANICSVGCSKTAVQRQQPLTPSGTMLR